MGEINFLTNGPKDDSAKNAKDKAENTKGTTVNALCSEKSSNFLGIKKAEKADSAEEQKRLEKSRQEVLEIIDKNKKIAKDDKIIAKNPASTKKKESWLGKMLHGQTDVLKKNVSDKAETPPSKNSKENANLATEAAPIAPNKTEVKKLSDIERSPLEIPRPPQKIETETLETSNAIIPDGIQSEKKSTDEGHLIFNTNIWNNPGVLETNLIDKSDFSFFDSSEKVKIIFIGVVASLFLVAASYAGLLYYEHSALTKLKEKKAEIIELEKKASALEVEIADAKKFQEKLGLTTKILNGHVFWSELFKFLEESTLANVFYVDGMNTSLGADFSLQATTDDYESIRNQLVVLFKDPRVTSFDFDNPEPFEEIIKQNNIPLENTAFAGEALATSTPPVIEKGYNFGLQISFKDNLIFKNQVSTTTVEKTQK